MTTSTGKTVKSAGPGTPVEVTGWKERPDAGDVVLQATNEHDAKLAIRNRLTKVEEKRDLDAVETINEKRLAARRARRFEHERKIVAEEVKRTGESLPGILRSDGNDLKQKEYRLLVKADVSGSAEAVEEAIKDLGNSEVKVTIIDARVGEVTESDIATAIAANGNGYIDEANG
jgi:translation initiation factor IF-2